ncbi:hypothetical protein HDE_12132 [Halotydeus destructor]|nr:hypothetical protein HDE_12132 [Halotydeus destructor]
MMSNQLEIDLTSINTNANQSLYRYMTISVNEVFSYRNNTPPSWLICDDCDQSTARPLMVLISVGLAICATGALMGFLCIKLSHRRATARSLVNNGHFKGHACSDSDPSQDGSTVSESLNSA